MSTTDINTQFKAQSHLSPAKTETLNAGTSELIPNKNLSKISNITSFQYNSTLNTSWSASTCVEGLIHL